MVMRRFPAAWLLFLVSVLVAACGGGSTPPSSAKSITAYSLNGVTGTIDEGNKTIVVTMPYGTAVTALVATFNTTGSNVVVGTTTQVSGITPNDFSSPSIYTVTAADSSTVDYTVTVTVALNSAKAITAYSINGVTGTINEANKTIAVTVPYGTSLSALVATFTTTGNSVAVGTTAQISGTTSNDFSSPVIYTVTAVDSSTVDYTVTVTISKTIGGKVSGLESGKNLVLQNNGVDDLTVSADGSFVFATQLTTGTSYNVTIKTLPINQPCTLIDGASIVSLSNVTNIDVACGPAVSGSFSATGSMAGARTVHQATLLANGKVLVQGGFDGAAYLSSAELYDPTAGTWAATGSMATARNQAFTATRLANGKVLVAGGFTGATTYASAELYDPVTGTWTATGNMTTARSNHTATLLPDGKVLVAGGFSGSAYLSSSELYDPNTGTWTATGNMASLRARHIANLLPNGKVLVSGGFGSGTAASAELFDPATESWTATGSMTSTRYSHASVLLPDGQVLVAGGFSGSSGLSSAELYDPSTGTWTATGSMSTTRYAHTLILLPTGKVLVSGGTIVGWGTIYISSELYDSLTGNWGAAANMTVARASHTATRLSNGKVLITGGVTSGSIPLASSELYW